MVKAKAHVTTPAVSGKSMEIAGKIASLINSRPTSPSLVEIARVIDDHGPEPVEYPAVADWRRRVAENLAVWHAAGDNTEDDDANSIDAELHAHCRELMARPARTWEDVGLLADIAMYWLYPPGTPSADPDGCNDLRYDMKPEPTGFDTQIVALLLNAISRLTGGRHC